MVLLPHFQWYTRLFSDVQQIVAAPIYIIVLLATVVLVAYLLYAPYVLEEYARYLVCLVSA